MGLITDESGTYSVDADGNRNYGTTTNIRINDVDIYEFNPQTGVLRMAASQESIDNLVECYGGLQNMSNITLPIPYCLHGPARFTGVKSIESNGQNILQIGRPRTNEQPLEKKVEESLPPQPSTPRSYWQRILDYFR